MGKLITIKANDNHKPGDVLTGYNSSFMVGDEELTGITSCDVRFRPDEIVTATLEVYVGVDLPGVEAEISEPGKIVITDYDSAMFPYHPRAMQAAFDLYDRDRWERIVDRAYFALK